VKKNCWEVKRCGRQPGGFHMHDLGVCPASLENKLDGVHGGKNAGRSCWVVAGTLCGGDIQGSFARKFSNCQSCEFYQMVQSEESGTFKMSIVLLSKMKEARA
jgi:hypothetical protein